VLILVGGAGLLGVNWFFTSGMVRFTTKHGNP
jgi:hypothetical protein